MRMLVKLMRRRRFDVPTGRVPERCAEEEGSGPPFGFCWSLLCHQLTVRWDLDDVSY